MNIRRQIIQEIIFGKDPIETYQISNAAREDKRSIETIIAEAASAYTRPSPKHHIIAHPSTPSLDENITEDGILCSIVSKLTLKEAVSTSILSSRWRYIWNYVPKLNFCAANMLEDHIVKLIYDQDSPLDDEDKSELMQGKTDQFIRTVDLVMRQLQGLSRVDEFEVRYFLNKIHSNHLDAWVRFAVESKIRQLALYLHKPFYLDSDEEQYDFPCQLLGSSYVEDLTLTYCSLKPPCTFNGLSNLKKLTLYKVDVLEEDITHLLSNCSSLEYLKLHMIPHLVSLNIPHPQSQFQTFIANECAELRGQIMINATNLTNLGYYGHPVDFIFKQSSHLIESFITFQTQVMEPDLDFYLNKLSRNLPQLWKLSCTLVGDFKVPLLPKGSSSSFTNLKRLDWCWNVNVQKMTIHHLTTLLDATPFLEELTLRLWSLCTEEKPPKRLRRLRKRLPKHPHTHLKTLQFGDFFWDKWHVEFTLFILKNAIALELVKFINGDNGPDEMAERGLDETTKNKLSQQLPPNAKLVIS